MLDRDIVRGNIVAQAAGLYVDQVLDLVVSSEILRSAACAVAGGFDHSLGLEGFAGGGCVRDPEWVFDGDTDGDGQVNPVDSGLVQASFGSTDETDLCQYDIDCDGQINPVDSGIVQSLFGTCEEPRSECP